MFSKVFYTPSNQQLSNLFSKLYKVHLILSFVLDLDGRSYSILHRASLENETTAINNLQVSTQYIVAFFRSILFTSQWIKEKK